MALGIQPIVVSPTPHTKQDPGRCLRKAVRLGEDLARCNFSHREFVMVRRQVLELLERIDAEFTVVWLTDAICADDVCRAAIDGVFIYRDVAHLSHEGSAWLGRTLRLDEMVTTGESNHEHTLYLSTGDRRAVPRRGGRLAAATRPRLGGGGD